MPGGWAFLRETGQATGGPVERRRRGWAEVARFFRPIDDWDIDRIIPTLLSGRPLNSQGVAVTPAEQVEIADRVYHVILDEAVDRFLASRAAVNTDEWQASTACSPSGWRSGQTSGGNLRTFPRSVLAIARGW